MSGDDSLIGTSFLGLIVCGIATAPTPYAYAPTSPFVNSRVGTV